jgi:serine/threonine protein kinase
MHFDFLNTATNATLTMQNQEPYLVKLSRAQRMSGWAEYLLSTRNLWNQSNVPVPNIMLYLNLTHGSSNTPAPTAAPSKNPVAVPTPSPHQAKEDVLYRWFYPVLLTLFSLIFILVGAVVRERWKVQTQQQRVVGLLNQKRDPDPLDDLLKDIEGSEWSLPFEFIEIGSKIGSGASGQVYMAKMGSHSVAAKQLFSHMVVSEYQEIQHEARLLSRLHHPALVRFYGITRNKVMVPADCGEGGAMNNSSSSGSGSVQMVLDKDELYLIMEYCPRSLAQLLAMKEFQITDNKFIGYAQQLAQGVAFLHSRGVIHRDLKPENVLEAQDGVLKLCDFGLSRMLAAPSTADGTKGGGDANSSGHTSGLRGMMRRIRSSTVDGAKHGPSTPTGGVVRKISTPTDRGDSPHVTEGKGRRREGSKRKGKKKKGKWAKKAQPSTPSTPGLEQPLLVEGGLSSDDSDDDWQEQVEVVVSEAPGGTGGRPNDPFDQTMTGGVGTPAYMAPELMQAEQFAQVRHGTAVDVYSFGMLLVALRLRGRPYGVRTTEEIIDGVANRGLRPDMPPALFPPLLRQLVSKCLSEDSSLRPGFLQILRSLENRNLMRSFSVAQQHRRSTTTYHRNSASGQRKGAQRAGYMSSYLHRLGFEPRPQQNPTLASRHQSAYSVAALGTEPTPDHRRSAPSTRTHSAGSAAKWEEYAMFRSTPSSPASRFHTAPSGHSPRTDDSRQYTHNPTKSSEGIVSAVGAPADSNPRHSRLSGSASVPSLADYGAQAAMGEAEQKAEQLRAAEKLANQLGEHNRTGTFVMDENLKDDGELSPVVLASWGKSSVPRTTIRKSLSDSAINLSLEAARQLEESELQGRESEVVITPEKKLSSAAQQERRGRLQQLPPRSGLAGILSKSLQPGISATSLQRSTSSPGHDWPDDTRGGSDVGPSSISKFSLGNRNDRLSRSLNSKTNNFLRNSFNFNRAKEANKQDPQLSAGHTGLQ